MEYVAWTCLLFSIVVPNSSQMLKITIYKTNVLFVGFEVSPAVTMKNDVLSDVAPCGSITNRRFGGSVSSIFRVEKIRE
jgi:hypothetical protein